MRRTLPSSTRDLNLNHLHKNGKVHPRLGFGLMDAEDMVKYAATWTQVPSQTSFQSSTSSPYLYVGAAGVSDSITIGSDCSVMYLEHVQVQLSFKADGIGYVELTLTSPSGTKSFLMTQRYQDYSRYASGTWTFMTVHHWGEAPQGQWTLKMVVPRYIGTLYTWKLVLYGTQTDPLPNINVCSGSPCAAGQTCTGNNYGYECTTYIASTTSSIPATNGWVSNGTVGTNITSTISTTSTTSSIATNAGVMVSDTVGTNITSTTSTTSTTSKTSSIAANAGGMASGTVGANFTSTPSTTSKTSSNAASAGGMAVTTVVLVIAMAIVVI